jgi:hypothetical protein
VAEKVRLLAVPNTSPEGPSNNTDIPIGELENAMAFIAKRGKLN